MEPLRFTSFLFFMVLSVAVVSSGPLCNCQKLDNLKTSEQSCLLNQLLQVISHLVGCSDKAALTPEGYQKLIEATNCKVAPSLPVVPTELPPITGGYFPTALPLVGEPSTESPQTSGENSSSGDTSTNDSSSASESSEHERPHPEPWAPITWFPPHISKSSEKSTEDSSGESTEESGGKSTEESGGKSTEESGSKSTEEQIDVSTGETNGGLITDPIQQPSGETILDYTPATSKPVPEIDPYYVEPTTESEPEPEPVTDSPSYFPVVMETESPYIPSFPEITTDSPNYFNPSTDSPNYFNPPTDPPNYFNLPTDPPNYFNPPTDPPNYVNPPTDSPNYFNPPTDPPLPPPSPITISPIPISSYDSPTVTENPNYNIDHSESNSNEDTNCQEKHFPFKTETFFIPVLKFHGTSPLSAQALRDYLFKCLPTSTKDT